MAIHSSGQIVWKLYFQTPNSRFSMNAMHFIHGLSQMRITTILNFNECTLPQFHISPQSAIHFSNPDYKNFTFCSSVLECLIWGNGGEWSALCPGSFTTKERALSTHRTGGQVGPRVSLVALAIQPTTTLNGLSWLLSVIHNTLKYSHGKQMLQRLKIQVSTTYLTSSWTMQ
jgi:hypothetical protein